MRSMRVCFQRLTGVRGFARLTVAAASAFLVFLFVGLDVWRRWQRSVLPAVQGPACARSIVEKYGIQIAWKDQAYPVTTHYGMIQAANLDTLELDRYCKLLAQEFLQYPPNLVRRSRLKRIVLCRGLNFDRQNRAALPDFEHDTLYLDVMRGDYSPIYQRAVIHHDFFHIVDYRDDGQLDSDQRWAELNPQSFKYGRGGAQMQDDPFSGLPSSIPGFLTGYATSAIEEDKAEIFAHMMTDYEVVRKRATTDRVIHKKVLMLKSLLARFCPDMDEVFWDLVSRRQSLNREHPILFAGS
jgi:hypothetical protein